MRPRTSDAQGPTQGSEVSSPLNSISVLCQGPSVATDFATQLRAGTAERESPIRSGLPNTAWDRRGPQQRFCKPLVGGSSPSSGTNKVKHLRVSDRRNLPKKSIWEDHGK